TPLLIEDLPPLLPGESLTRSTRFPGGTFRFPLNSAGLRVSTPETHTIWLLADASETSLSTTMTVQFDTASGVFEGGAPGSESFEALTMAPLMAAAPTDPPVPALASTPHTRTPVTWSRSPIAPATPAVNRSPQCWTSVTLWGPPQCSASTPT